MHVKQQVPGGRVVENTIEIAALEPPRRISERSVGGRLRFGEHPDNFLSDRHWLAL